VGVVTSISVAGVAAGVAALIIALCDHHRHAPRVAGPALGQLAACTTDARAGDGIRDCSRFLSGSANLPIDCASPTIYEQVMVARGARDGGAMVEGILPDQE